MILLKLPAEDLSWVGDTQSKTCLDHDLLENHCCHKCAQYAGFQGQYSVAEEIRAKKHDTK